MNEYIGRKAIHRKTGVILDIIAYDIIDDRFKCKFGFDEALYNISELILPDSDHRKPEMKNDRDEMIAKGAIAMYDTSRWYDLYMGTVRENNCNRSIVKTWN